MEKIYLDYAASTPVDPRVFEAMKPYFTEKFGNPGSLHSFGQEAIAVVDKSRETIAKAIDVDFREIIFTGSATEANNLVLRGVAVAFAKKNGVHPQIIISSIEHESVFETARDLEQWGIEVIYLPVDKRGIVDLEKLKASLNDRTALVSIMYANNEIGTIQPIAEISKIVQGFRVRTASELPSFRAYPLLHTDAVQAFQFLDCNPKKLGVDLMTFSAHKMYGPKGIGALYIRDGGTMKFSPQTTGGGQEFGLRSGTENVPLIAGFAKAVEMVTSDKEQVTRKIKELRDHFLGELKKIYPKAEMNGCENHMPHATCHMSPHILNVYFPNHESQDLLTKFDMAGLAVSAGSACRSRAVESSYVIEALGYSKDRAKWSIRFSFGRPTTREEVDQALVVIKKCIG